jgi:hypothetical protein
MTHCLRTSKLFVCKITSGKYSFLKLYTSKETLLLKLNLKKKRSLDSWGRGELKLRAI